MFKLIFIRIFIFFLSLTNVAFPQLNADTRQSKHELAVVCMFYNEAEYLKEWIEFHKLVGVDHFYLYNNNSDDHYEEVLSPYIQSGIVDLLNWPSPPHLLYTKYQCNAYRHCIKEHKHHAKWMAFIDTDEFIVPLCHSTIPEFLKEYESYGGVFVNWQCYGTSHLPYIPEEKLMVECLTLKYPWDHDKNCFYKTIAQPSKIKDYYIHGGSYKKGSYAVTPSFKNGPPKFPDIERIRINHYWTRAEDFFFNVKIPRVEEYSKRTITQEEIDEILINSNSVEDLTIYPFLPNLKEAMGYE